MLLRAMQLLLLPAPHRKGADLNAPLVVQPQRSLVLVQPVLVPGLALPLLVLKQPLLVVALPLPHPQLVLPLLLPLMLPLRQPLLQPLTHPQLVLPLLHPLLQRLPLPLLVLPVLALMEVLLPSLQHVVSHVP